MNGDEARGITKRYLIAWMLLTGAITVAVVLAAAAFYVNYTENQAQMQREQEREQERTERSEDLNQYLRVSCRNDRRGWQVLIEILEDASRTADDPVTRKYWSEKLGRLVDVSEQCLAAIPPPLPNPQGG